MTKIKNTLLALTGISALIYFYRLFTLPSSEMFKHEFPEKAEKAAAVKEVAHLKEEIKEVAAKEYSDEEIEKKFNH